MANKMTVNYLGFAKNGSKVISQSADQRTFQVRCACGRTDIKSRDYLRNAARGRALQCYECSCRQRQETAIKTAAKRARVCGQFAPGKVA